MSVLVVPSAARAIAAGGMHNCAALVDGTLRCWGWNEFGQFGDGTSLITGTVGTGIVGLGITGAGGFTLGYGSSCAIEPGGVEYCWGDNQYGQLGDGTTTDRLLPVRVTGL